MPSLRQQHLAENGVYHVARQRCTNPRDKSFKWYGARGIEFRFKSFKEFIECLGPCPDGLTLDRIDTNGHYEPGNVRWADIATQIENRRNVKPIAYKGKTQSAARWAKEYGLHPRTLRGRLERGMSIEEALTVKMRKPPRSCE
jgi:hypothetical protein